MAKRLMPMADGVGQSFAKLRFGSDVTAKMRHSEGDVPRFILCRETADGGGDRVRSGSPDEPEQRQERAFAEHGEQK